MDCEKWLSEYLEKYKGGVLCQIVRQECKKNGYSQKQLKESRKKLDVKTFHQFDGYGATDNWFWYLPVHRDVKNAQC